MPAGSCGESRSYAGGLKSNSILDENISKYAANTHLYLFHYFHCSEICQYNCHLFERHYI